jgi:hypothetical protein
MDKESIVLSKKHSRILKIDDSVRKEVFSGTFEDAKIKDDEYCLFTLYSEKLYTIAYLSELFYGKNETTSRF